MTMVAGFWGFLHIFSVVIENPALVFLVNIPVNDTFYPATLQPKVSVLSVSGVTLLSG